MGQVSEVCQNCVWLDHGKVRLHGRDGSRGGKILSVVQERQNAELHADTPDEWEALEAERMALEEARLREGRGAS
jgi:hypothetical protein